MDKSTKLVDGVFWSMEDELRLRQLDQLSAQQEHELDDVLQKFPGVFKEISGLPPSRGRTHSITLKEGTELVNVMPYRYSHQQKNEIERQVQELLDLGIIRNSSSRFSRPLILVKKKDGSWRMCVDYRALNRVTIHDKFSIPVVDELINELQGACFFS